MLESQETLPAQISSAGHLRHMRRVHAEHHASLVSAALRTTFSLDIPSDASPAFQVEVGDGHGALGGGLAWRVRLSLLVAVTGESAPTDGDGVRFRQMGPDAASGEWGTAYTAYPSIAPKVRAHRETESATWTQLFVSSLLGEREYHDGDEEEDLWADELVETVECEVPIRVWGGSTAFRAPEVVFDV